MNQKLTLKVKVQTPKEVLFEGKALAVSSKNNEGKFDILPQHANFITLIEKNPIELIKEDNQKLKFGVNQAIIYHVQNQVSIYIDPQSLPSSQT